MDIEQNKISEASNALYHSLLKGGKDVAYNLDSNHALVVKKKWKKISFSYFVNGATSSNQVAVRNIPWPAEPADFSSAVAENVLALVAQDNALEEQENVSMPDDTVEQSDSEELTIESNDQVEVQADDPAAMHIDEQTEEAAGELADEQETTEPEQQNPGKQRKGLLGRLFGKKNSPSTEIDDEEELAELNANAEDDEIWGEEPVAEELPDAVLEEMEQNDTTPSADIEEDVEYGEDEDLLDDELNDEEEFQENPEDHGHLSADDSEDANLFVEVENDEPGELEESNDFEETVADNSEAADENELNISEENNDVTGSEEDPEFMELPSDLAEGDEDLFDDDADNEDFLQDDTEAVEVSQEDDDNEILEEGDDDMGKTDYVADNKAAETTEAATTDTKEAPVVNELALVAQSKLTDSQLGHMITKNTDEFVSEITAVFKNLVELDHDIARRLYISAIVSCIKIYDGNIEEMCEKLGIDERDAIMANYEYQIMLLNNDK